MPRMYTASKMGFALGLPAVEVNALLEERGWQESVAIVGSDYKRKWVATGEGIKHSWIRKGNKGLLPYEILVWDEFTLDSLGAIKPPNRNEFNSLIERIKVLEELLNVQS